ncbi:hypothetical protein [Flavobacterium psychrotrophum]|uniref:hypothetical protein n=1 Tax=Flavobacterium psychrotrophum TaxID=2294119 RepID=UPI000E318458|nr:hypothetical protein [Flavobacterium psychrotrophum]
MYLRTSLAKSPGGSPGAAAPKEPNVTIFAADDVAVWPLRDDGSVNMLGSFVMKPNARMYTFYSTKSKTSAPFEAEGEEDNITYKQSFVGEYPGDDLPVNEFIANWTGVNAIIIYGSCADSFRKVVGTKCAPVQLKATGKDDNEGRAKTLTFEQYAKSRFLPGHYTGALIYAEPFPATSAVFAINETNGNHYQLPSMAVTDDIEPSALDLPVGQIVTLIGGGGAAPATLAQGTAGAADILLVAGSTWTALQGASISLRVFNAGAKKYLIEVSRS